MDAPRGLPDLGARVLIAAPAAAAAVLLTLAGGPAFAVALGIVGAVAVSEAYGLLQRARPARAAGLVAVAALPPAALAGGETAALLVVMATLPLAFAASRSTPGVAESIAATVLGVAWIGLPLAHGVLLRDLPHGEALVLAVLIGTFLGDTGAHLIGATFGRRPLAPRLSPAKTVEGLVAGVVVGTAAVWLYAALSQEWLTGWGALALGLAVSAAAPLGDLFESLVKRSAGAKDSGRLLGPHGGLLDRIDAVLFAAVAGYYAGLALT